MVGARSMTWVNCDRRPPGSSMPVRPVDDGAVAGAAPVRRHLLGPLQRGVHRPRPADGVVVVGAGRAELVHLAHHELRRLERGHAVEVGHLVERAVDGALGRRPVVAEDVVDDRVVEDLEVAHRVDQPSDVVVGVLEEPGVDLHLARQHRLQLIGHVVPGGDLVVPLGQLRVRGDHAELLLAGEGPLALHVPSLVELTGVLLDPLAGHVVGRMGGARREVDEERLLRHQGLLLAHPAHGPVGQVLGQVVALLRGRRRLDGVVPSYSAGSHWLFSPPMNP